MKEFHLTGNVRWAVGSCHDDRSMDIDKRFPALNEEKGIEMARKEIQKLHKEYSFRTDYGLGAELRLGRKLVWDTYFRDDQPAVEAVPAQKARLAVAAHFVEKRFKKR